MGVVLLASACVGGDDKSDAATQGSLGGPCFANNTCNSGLDCVLQNGKGVCEASDASVQDASGDTTTNDATGDAPNDVTSDVQVDAGCDSGLTPGAACFGNCTGELCCPLNGQCFTSGCGVSPCNGMCWSCAKGSDCSGQYCCATNSTTQPTCPLNTNIGPSTNVFCSAIPCAGGLFLCVNNSDCPSTAPTCTPAKANGLNTSTIGVCQ